VSRRLGCWELWMRMRRGDVVYGVIVDIYGESGHEIGCC
jgi:hypothetical protein